MTFPGCCCPLWLPSPRPPEGSPARQCGRGPQCCVPACSSGGIDGLLVPLLYAYIAACCAHAALGSDGLKKLAALIKGTIVFLLTAGLLAFVGYLTASGAIAGSADAAAVKAAKMTISRAIPVVGGILSDAAETVLAGAGVLRGTVGVVGMLVVLDSIFNRIIRNRGLKRNTWIYIDEIYLLFQHEYSANFLFTLWKRMRKYQACGTGISQNIEDLLQSHTARTMLANSEFLIMLNQAATDREELAHLLNISDNQLSYITNVDSGRGLIKCGSAIVPFVDHFPKNKLYRLMTTKPSDLAA